MKRLLISYLLLLSGCAAGLDSVTYRPVKQEDGGMTIGIGSVTIKTAQQAQPVADDAPARALVAPQQDALTLLFAQAAASGVPVTIQIGASPTPDAILSRGLETPLPVDIVSLPMTIEPTPALNEEGHALITPTPAPVKPKPPRAKMVKTPRPTPTPEVLLTPAPDACLQIWQPYHVSIHAPARGATLRLIIDNDILRVSIHAPARGATASTEPVDNTRLLAVVPLTLSMIFMQKCQARGAEPDMPRFQERANLPAFACALQVSAR